MANRIQFSSNICDYAWILVPLIIAVTVKVLVRILAALRGEASEKAAAQSDSSVDLVKEKASTAPSRQNKKKSAAWKTAKAGFEHEFLVTNLMGHTGRVLGMDCTTDAKYLVTCAEDEPPPDPGDFTGCSSSGSEGGAADNRDSGGDSAGTSPRRTARRRRKPRPPVAPVQHQLPHQHQLQHHLQHQIQITQQTYYCPPPPVVVPAPPPLQRYAELNLNEMELAGLLGCYQLRPEQLKALGYPVESSAHPTRAVIYAVDFSPPQRKFDVNAREFVPGATLWREEDSGRGSGSSGSSGSSSPRSPDSDADSEESREPGVERRCARCTRGFLVTAAGEYVTRERCRHHWGRLQRVPTSIWSCCGAPPAADGCSRAPLHVWSGTCAGFNGPLEGFVRTRPRLPGAPARRLLALDCEMCYTAAGLQIARVEVVGADGRRVYGSFVRPDAPVVDYNTRFSGISARDLRDTTKSLKDVQLDLLSLMDADTILVGHGLENDLRALRLLHGRVVDSAVSFPHARGLPFRRSLRALAAQHLSRPVQESRHCPLEDARASLELMLYRVQRDFIMPHLHRPHAHLHGHGHAHA